MFGSADSFRPTAIAAMLIVAMVVPCRSPAQDAELELEQQIRKVVDASSESIVGLEMIGGSGRADGARKSTGPGTAIVVDSDGWVLTASYHFADQPSGVVATLPGGKKVSAETVATDRARNLTLLKLDTDQPLKPILVSPRSDLRVGQTVVAVGRGFDVQTMQISTGIISAVDRVWGRAIQTDAKISPANYGGPLLNLRGQAVGILAPLSPRGEKVMSGTEWYDSGIGFAVPIDEVLRRMAELKKGNDQFSGKLGVSFEGSDIYVGDCEIAFCTGSSPAGQAGLRPGDIITAINGQPTPRQAAFRHLIGPLYAGQQANISVNRNNKPIELSATLTDKLPPYQPVGIGVAVSAQTVDANDNKSVNYIIRQIERSSPAEKAGLQIGDIIHKANATPVKKALDLVAQIAATTTDDSIGLTILRNGQSLEFDIPVAPRTATVPEATNLNPVESTALTLKFADVPNACFAIVPKKTVTKPGLIVWLAEPGELDPDTLKKEWKTSCQQHQMTLLVVGASDKREWRADEVDVVVKAIATLNKREALDRSRIVVGGAAAGGTMASLVCFNRPGLFRGLILDSATLSAKLPEVRSNPVAPMMVLTNTRGQQEQSLAPLVQAKLPIHKVGMIDTDQIVRWATFVDRL